MSEQTLLRSPEMMSRNDTAVLVVDVQEKLIRLLPDHERIVWNIRRLIDGAQALDLHIASTEQYPQGLGGTVDVLAQRLGTIMSKQAFSCAGCQQLVADLTERDITKLLVVGIEAHVCVQQTVLDMLASGLAVFVAADAIGSRSRFDAEIAMRRMESAGATVTTTEAALFEWCEVSGTPEFKVISNLIKESAPGG